MAVTRHMKAKKCKQHQDPYWKAGVNGGAPKMECNVDHIYHTGFGWSWFYLKDIKVFSLLHLANTKSTRGREIKAKDVKDWTEVKNTKR